MTKRQLAYCGLDCANCPALVALANDDKELKIKTAREWSKLYNADIKPEDIECTGCVSREGVKFGHCHKCEIRKCADVKGLETCAHCDKFACEKVSWLLDAVPEAKENLEEERKNV